MDGNILRPSQLAFSEDVPVTELFPWANRPPLGRKIRDAPGERRMAGGRKMPTRVHHIAIVVLPIMLLAGVATWFLVSTLDESDAQTPEPDAVAVAPDQSEVRPDAATTPQQQGPVSAEAVQPSDQPLDHLRIATQSFRRGGLGSKALVTFTLRNGNDYAIKDPEILCSFRSKDGRYSTERRRTINDTVDMKSRKTFPRTLIGFVNIKASKAKCSLLTASRG
jgi:hypothetical protein